MPDERQMWVALRPYLDSLGLDPVRVENPALPGTPDVNFKEGWIELKHADSWPVKGGPLRLVHPPTPQQRSWLYRRWTAGGACWLLLRVGREWFLLEPPAVAEMWKRTEAPTKAAIHGQAVLMTTDPSKVAQFLKEGRK